MLTTSLFIVIVILSQTMLNYARRLCVSFSAQAGSTNARQKPAARALLLKPAARATITVFAKQCTSKQNNLTVKKRLTAFKTALVDATAAI